MGSPIPSQTINEFLFSAVKACATANPRATMCLSYPLFYCFFVLFPGKLFVIGSGPEFPPVNRFSRFGFLILDLSSLSRSFSLLTTFLFDFSSLAYRQSAAFSSTTRFPSFTQGDFLVYVPLPRVFSFAVRSCATD